MHNGSPLLCLPIFSSARLAVAQFFDCFFSCLLMAGVCVLNGVV